MNQKVSVSKDLSAKHAKILEGLLKLPENRECADCKSKAPRWASINLGIFICLQCSGIHRSLGVHISKVRSTTLDTWLPEQVSFMQMMGNKKSNDYWEAELSPQCYRNPIDKFIRTKYVDKKWVSRTSMPPAQSVGEVNSGDTSGKGIPRKARKYSWDDKLFAKDVSVVSPATQNCWGSFDMMNDIISAPPNVITSESNSSGLF